LGATEDVVGAAETFPVGDAGAVHRRDHHRPGRDAG
jgi:hypothetical protein